MAKVIALGLFVLIAGVVAEPPVGYLPPQAQRGSPASVYGAPLAGSLTGKASSSFRSRSGSTSVSYSALHDAQASQEGAAAFGGSGSFSRQYAGNAGAFGSGHGVSHMQVGPNAGGLHFGTSFGSSPAFGVSQQYAAPAVGAVNAAGSAFESSFGAVGPSPSFSLSQQYGAPHAASANGFNAAGSNGAFGSTRLNAFSGSSSFKANRFGNSLQQYKAPAAGAGSFGASFGSYSGSAGLRSASLRNGFQGSPQYSLPASGSGATSFKSGSATASGAFFGSSAGSLAGNSFGSFQSNALGVSRQYGAPAVGAGAGNRFGATLPVYGAPNNAAYSAEEEQLEPANYEYNYEVQAADVSGVQFGHQESREDEDAKGAYHVLLPDGRTQVVEYEANEGGYQPKIRYEEPASGRAHTGGLSGPY